MIAFLYGIDGQILHEYDTGIGKRVIAADVRFIYFAFDSSAKLSETAASMAAASCDSVSK